MKRIEGKPISPGYAEGRAFIYGVSGSRSIPEYSVDRDKTREETERFERAIVRSVAELEQLRDHIVHELGESESEIFEAHLMMLKDSTFIQKINKRVETELINAEKAVIAEIGNLEKLLMDVKDEYLQERSQDFRDVGRRILKNLSHESERGDSIKKLPSGIILVAHELLPSDTIFLDRKNVAAILTEKGGTSSHTAILASSLGIPFVTGIKDITYHIKHDDRLLVDASQGIVIISPDKTKFDVFKEDKKRYDEAFRYAEEQESKICATKDGEEIYLYANIGRIEELDMVRQHHLHGVGLFRTEYLFLESPAPPSKDKQAGEYRKIMEMINPLPVVIRTFDLGGDKNPLFLKRDFESNPNIGLRGLRFALANRDLFSTQLDAILKTARDGEIQILLPMILGPADLDETLSLIKEAAERENVAVLPKIGAMIETPAAVFEIDEIIKRVDFISVGTNDLTQFILAADRGAPDMMDYYSATHPAVIKAIRHVIVRAAEHDCPLTICGEAAGIPVTAALFIGMGVKRLSMSPVRATMVSRMIRNIRYEDFKAAAEEALTLSDSGKVERLFKSCIDNTSIQ